MSTAYIGLGGNLGARESYLERALRKLAALPETTLTKRSRWHETSPVGGPPQGMYLNGVARIETTLQPRELLGSLKKIEETLGRPAIHPHWGPRVIDLDLLAYEDLVLETTDLVLPHPHLAERLFVLIPMSEIAPAWRHPRLGKTAAQLLTEQTHAYRSETR